MRKKDPSTSSGANGSPSDALSAFIGAATDLTSGPTADPQVSLAFALGWQMAELYRRKRRFSPDPARPEDLPGIGSLGDAQLIDLGLHQIEAGIAKLSRTITAGGQTVPSIQSALNNMQNTKDHNARDAIILQLHVELLSTLTAADFRLGKAYGLGRALADTCRNPQSIEDLEHELKRERIAMVGGWIGDLSSNFPPHAGHSVRDSLERWSEAVSADPSRLTLNLDGTLSRLRRQGALWRSLLSGEKQGEDMLELSDYVMAAESLIVRFRALALQMIDRFKVLSAIIVLLFLGGIALVAVAGSSASIVAGATAIFASLGLTWKGVGASLGRAVAKIEQPAWEAQLDLAIADAITLLPEDLAPASDTAGRTFGRLKRSPMDGTTPLAGAVATGPRR